jgi:metal-sulfur cluster biosynthetic enzyme
VTRPARIALQAGLTVGLVALGVFLVNAPTILRAGRTPAFAGPAVLADSGRVPPDSLPLDSARAIAAIEKVRDPELDVNIVELGLVDSLAVSGRDISLAMMLTTPECPYGKVLAVNAIEALLALPGAGWVKVRVDLKRRWDPSRVSPAVRERWRRIAAPKR